MIGTSPQIIARAQSIAEKWPMLTQSFKFADEIELAKRNDNKENWIKCILIQCEKFPK